MSRLLSSAAPLLLPVLCAGLVQVAAGRPASGPGSLSTAAAPQARAAYGMLPLSFEPAAGPERQFVSRGSGYRLAVSPAGAVLDLQASHAASATQLRMELLGSRAGGRVEPQSPLPGRVNYFLGNDPSRWVTNVPTFGRVRCAGVFPGVDVVYYGSQSHLEYDIVVAPGADPAAVRWRLSGAERVELDRAGDMVLHVPGGSVVQKRPVVYQERDGHREPVEGRYLLASADGGAVEVGFSLGAYDRSRPVVIDPVLTYSTYLGGSNIDKALALAVDTGGSAYVTGSTVSTDFPTASPLQAAQGGTAARGDVFVAKLDPSGSTLLFATYIGGGGGDDARGIALDAAGNAYLTGRTDSGNFPTANALFPTARGDEDAFLLKLSASGSTLAYSTYLGGQGRDRGLGVAVDGEGYACVAGLTGSLNFPVVNAVQPTPSLLGDAFAARMAPDGGSLAYSTYLGGNRQEMIDEVGGVAVDQFGSAYVVGNTSSNDFPTTEGALDTALGGQPGTTDGFVVKLLPSGGMSYSTYFGGSGDDAISCVGVDSLGQVCVAGSTVSADLPLENAVRDHYTAGDDAFVAKLTSAGNALVYSTYLGGSGTDKALALTVDGAGSAYVVGLTFSSDFPVARPLQPPAGNFDAFVARLNPSGTSLVFSSYLGGISRDEATGIGVDGSGEVYVAGHTLSSNFPVLFPYQATSRGNVDIFVTRISEGLAPPVFPSGLATTSVCNTSLGLTWVDNSDDEDAFEIERKAGGGVFLPVAAVEANTVVYEDSGLTPNTSYVYRVRATNGDGASAYSNEVSVVTLASTVNPPSGLTVVPVSPTALKLTWQDNSTDEAGFRVERSTDAGTTYVRVQTVAPNTVEFTDGGLLQDHTYTYRLRAVGSGCDSLPTPSFTASTPPEPVNAPTNLAGLASDTTVALSWKDNSDNETGFRVEKKGATTFEPLATVAANVELCTDTGLFPNTQYTYRVVALNGSAVSAPTQEFRITTIAPPTGVLKVAKKVDFGKVLRGTTREKILTIKNGSRADRMRITVGTLAAPFTVTGAGTYNLLVGGNRSISLKFTPTAAQKYSTKLIITSTDPKHSRVEVTLSGTGK